MAFKVNNKFQHGETVYLFCDVEQSPRMVVYITVYAEGVLAYGLTANGEETEHWEFEIAKERQVM